MSALSVNEMRNWIISQYPNAGVAWKKNVLNNMPANQVIAFFRSLQERAVNKIQRDEDEKKYHQMTIFEYLAMKEAKNG